MSVLVRSIVIAWFVFAGVCGVRAQIATQPVIADPPTYTLELIKLLETGGADRLAERLGIDLANPAAKSTLSSALVPFEKKSAKIAKVAADRVYGEAVRVVTTYIFGLHDQHPFLYFQQTFKMTDRGWVITGFNFRTEAMSAFPSDMVQFTR
jgi:hypothetical protein